MPRGQLLKLTNCLKHIATQTNERRGPRGLEDRRVGFLQTPRRPQPPPKPRAAGRGLPSRALSPLSDGPEAGDPPRGPHENAPASREMCKGTEGWLPPGWRWPGRLMPLWC